MNTARFVIYPLLAVLGVLAGGAGAMVQAGWFPFGLLLALGGAAGLFWGGAVWTGTKLGAAAPAAGWALVVLMLTVSRPQGDFMFGAGASSYLFLFGGMAAGAVCVAMAPTDRPMFDMAPSAAAGGRTGRR